MTTSSPPDPEELQSRYDQMPEKVSLFRYWGCVTTLRGKGYSWRDISGMLEKDGIKISFTQLYRHEKRLEAGLVREDEEDGT